MNSIIERDGTFENNSDRVDTVILKKWSKKRIMVPRPFAYGEYNKYMGGTDRMDENINMYRIGIRGKKWWWPLFTWMIDAAIHNTWILAKGAGSEVPQLEFRRQLAQTYLTRYQNPPKGPGRPAASHASSTGCRVSDEIRCDGLHHIVYPTEDGKRRRCAGDGCSTVGPH